MFQEERKIDLKAIEGELLWKKALLYVFYATENVMKK